VNWTTTRRESAAESLRHVGSLSAPSEELALEQATTLFDHAAETIWLCPADETRRFRTRQLGADHVTDAAFLVEYTRREYGAERARRVREYLEVNGGDPAGERVDGLCGLTG
jgi:rSAM-partnered protein